MTTDSRARITLRRMEQFIAVAEELHFHRAAERLNMSQPPLTSAIQKLEEDLGVTLIERGNRVLGLTLAGETFVSEARETLRQAEKPSFLLLMWLKDEPVFYAWVMWEAHFMVGCLMLFVNSGQAIRRYDLNCEKQQPRHRLLLCVMGC